MILITTLIPYIDLQKEKLSYLKGFDTRILIIVFFPGLTEQNLKDQIENTFAKVIILMTYGSGNIPLNEKLWNLLKSLFLKGFGF